MAKANRKNPVLVEVTSNGQVIGKLTTKEFRDYMGRSNCFLQDQINDFNELKSRLGEPERASITLNTA